MRRLKCEYPHAPANYVGEHIRRVHRPARNEMLMQFVGDAKQRDEREDDERASSRRRGERTRRQPREHAIHRDVHELVSAGWRRRCERRRDGNGRGDENERGPAYCRTKPLKWLTQSIGRPSFQAARDARTGRWCSVENVSDDRKASYGTR